MIDKTLALSVAILTAGAIALPGCAEQETSSDADETASVTLPLEKSSGATDDYSPRDGEKAHRGERAKRGKKGRRGGRRGMAMMGRLDAMDADGDKTITKEEARAAALKTFGELDADSDGQLSEQELSARRPEASPQRRRGGRMGRRMLQRLDTDDSGTISQEEFVAGHLKMFERLDQDRDGSVSLDELKSRPGMRGRMGD